MKDRAKVSGMQDCVSRCMGASGRKKKSHAGRGRPDRGCTMGKAA